MGGNYLPQALFIAENIGKIVSILATVFAIVWSVISVVRILIVQMKAAVDAKDWEELLRIINELVIAAEQKFAKEGSAGAEKKKEVLSLIEKAGYEVTAVIDALVESAVFRNFNKDKLSGPKQP